MVSDSNLVNSDNKAVKVQTITLSTLHTVRGELRGTHVGCSMRNRPYAPVRHGAHAVICGIVAADI